MLPEYALEEKHVFCQVECYTTSRSKITADTELYLLSQNLLHLGNEIDVKKWVEKFIC